jgi:non-specific serine/threonine protein kinase
MLSGGPRNVPARHQTLHAAIAWSYDLLTPAEQRLLRQLAVFSGGCTLEAVEAVARSDTNGEIGSHGGGANPHSPPPQPHVPSPEILDTLASLVDHSLLRRDDGPDGEPRFSMLETIREFALARMAQSSEYAALRARHAASFLALAERSLPSPFSPEYDAALAALEAELANFREAFEWFLCCEDGEPALRLALALEPLWRRGRLSEGKQWLSRALAVGERTPTARRARGLTLLAWFVAVETASTAGGEYYEQGLAIYRALGDKQNIAYVLYRMGHAARNVCDYASARRSFEESLALHSTLGDAVGSIECRAWLGDLVRRDGNYALARCYLEQSLAAARSTPDVPGLTTAHLAKNLARLASDEGDYAAACAYFLEELDIVCDLRDAFHAAFAMSSGLLPVACLLSAAGQLEHAARLLASANAMREASRRPWTPVDLADYDPLVAALRTAQSPAAFDSAWAEGRAMALEQALAFARQALTGLPLSDAVEAGALRRSVAGAARNEHGVGPPTHPAPSLLTARESEVAALVAQGLSNRQIAVRLTITERTAENHVRHMLARLGFRSRAQIAAWAVAHDLAAPTAS